MMKEKNQLKGKQNFMEIDNFPLLSVGRMVEKEYWAFLHRLKFDFFLFGMCKDYVQGIMLRLFASA